MILFWVNSLQKKVKASHLETVPTRLLLFGITLFVMTIFDICMQVFDSSLNTNISFDHYHISPRVAHLFKDMGNAYISEEENKAPNTSLSNDTPLFRLENKLNPVFLEHGELNVKCKYITNMDLACYYIGVIKEPKYYIQEVTFNNSVPDILPYNFHITGKYVPPLNYTERDSYSKLAAYFYIFENLPSQVFRNPTLELISQTNEFQILRERISVIYMSAIKWTYMSNYISWFTTLFFALSHFMMMVTKMVIKYMDKVNGQPKYDSSRFLEKLRVFSVVQLLLCYVYYIMHRLIVLLNGVVQSFLFGSLSENITFKSTKSTVNGGSLFKHLLGFLTLLWILILFHRITFRDVMFFQPPKETTTPEELQSPMREGQAPYSVHNSKFSPHEQDMV